MKRILVTGGSGFVGRHLIGELLTRYQDVEVVSVSRSEGAICHLQVHCDNNERLKIVLGDVRDADVVRYAAQGCDTVIHLAAMKRVDLSEMQPREAITTNVIGTLNVLDSFRGSTFILMSTDKAVEPVNCYGASKFIAERLVLERARSSTGARFMVVRSGNILGSTGSVLDIWKNQMAQCNEITVTNPDMLRFYVSVIGIVRLFVSVLEQGESGQIYFSPHGDSIYLRDLVRKAIRRYGNRDTRCKYIGLRPGERMQEKMRSENELNTIAGFEAHIPAESIVTIPEYEYAMPWISEEEPRSVVESK